MEWIWLSTGFHDDRKTAELDAAAIALWMLCLSWSGARGTRGFIPRRIAMRFQGGHLGAEAAARLVQAGFGDAVDGGDRRGTWGKRLVREEESRWSG
jgi:hypothetical protein